MQALSVSQLLERLKQSLGLGFPQVCVAGEVVDPFLSRQGHFYLRLRDPGGELKVVMWRPQVQRHRLLPQAGDRVVVRGGLTVYAPKGDLQLQAVALAPDGQGDHLAELARRRERLRQEGLFDRPKRPLPFLPHRLGVVTSLGSAVLHDIVQCVRRRNPAVEIWLAPAAVSGADAAQQVQRGLRWLAGRVDVVIVARGGGSFEELLPFSDEALVRAVADYSLPVISAIGHGSDSPLLDLVADQAAPTPTAAAELATPCRDTLLARHRELQWAMRQALQQRARRCRAELELVQRLVQSHRPEATLARGRQRWWGLQQRLHRAWEQQQGERRGRWQRLQRACDGIPWEGRLQGHRYRLQGLTDRLLQAQQERLQQARQTWDSLTQTCRHLGPESVLHRGFALVLSQGRPVTTVSGRSPGEELELQFADGALRVVVSSVQPAPEERRGE